MIQGKYVLSLEDFYLSGLNWIHSEAQGLLLCISTRQPINQGFWAGKCKEMDAKGLEGSKYILAMDGNNDHSKEVQ